jgi:hypothetical protein
MSVELVLARIAQIEAALSAPSAASAATLTAAATPTSSATSATTTAATSTPTATTAGVGGSSATTASFADTLVSALAPEADATATLLDDGGTSSPAADQTTVSSALSQLLAADPALGAAGSTLATTPTAASAGGGNQSIVQIAQSQVGVTEQPPGSNDSPTIAAYRSATSGAIPGAPWCAYFVSWVARQAGEPLGAQGQGFGSVADIWSWAQQTGRAVTNGPGVVPQPGDLIVFGDHHVGIVDQVLPDGDIETVEGNYDNSVSMVTRSPDEATGYVRMS